MSWEPEKKWMQLAIDQAQCAFQAKEVPIGAILVQGSTLISSAFNMVECSNDPSKHAELECLRLGASRLSSWRLQDCTLYCTLEPCVMCYGAMVHFRLGRLVWGAPDLRHGALGSLYDLSQRRHPIHQVEWRGFFMQEPCQRLLQDFFRLRRQENKQGAHERSYPVT